MSPRVSGALVAEPKKGHISQNRDTVFVIAILMMQTKRKTNLSLLPFAVR